MTNEDTFDPAAVPPFPVFRLTVESDGSATFNGTSVDVEPGGDPIDAAVAAAAAEASRLNLAAVRTTGTHNGEKHDLVITAEGARYDTTPRTDEDDAVRARKRRRIGVAALIGVAVVLVGVLVLSLVLMGRNAQPAAPVAQDHPGAGQEVPIKLPAQYDTRATWSVPVSDGAGALVLNNGDILSSEEGDLVARKAETGVVTWKGSNAPQSTQSVRETTWAGKPVLASSDGQNITLWPQYLNDDVTPPVSISTEATATISYAGDTPLIDLGDYTVGTPGDGSKLSRLTIPTGSKAVANNNGLVTSIGDRVLIDTNVQNGKQSTPRKLTLPSGLTGPPGHAYGIDATHAVGIWTKGNVSNAVLIDTKTGKFLASTVNQTNIDEAILDKASKTALLGSLFITVGEKPAMASIDTTGTSTLTGGSVFTNNTQSAAVWSWDKGKIIRKSWPRFKDDDPVPAARTASALYVVAHQVDHDQLYRVGLAHTATPTASATTAPPSSAPPATNGKSTLTTKKPKEKKK